MWEGLLECLTHTARWILSSSLVFVLNRSDVLKLWGHTIHVLQVSRLLCSVFCLQQSEQRNDCTGTTPEGPRLKQSRCAWRICLEKELSLEQWLWLSTYWCTWLLHHKYLNNGWAEGVFLHLNVPVHAVSHKSEKKYFVKSFHHNIEDMTLDTM